MVNKTYLPGDVIVPPYGLGETMYCITSGVIEILSEENDDSPIISLEGGSCIGEASLFISVPKKTTIRAATYVDFQERFTCDFVKSIKILMKILHDFADFTQERFFQGIFKISGYIQIDVQRNPYQNGNEQKSRNGGNY